MVTSPDWNSALRRTMISPQLPHLDSTTPYSKSPSLELWNGILGQSILKDLEFATEDEDVTTTMRFIRISHSELNGVILYPAPARRAAVPDKATIEAEVADLVEANVVQILPLPEDVGTSFLTGQVIKAHLLSDPSIRPKLHRSGSGFSVNLHAFDTLALSLARIGTVPVRDLSSELKPTPNCAPRFGTDRRHSTPPPTHHALPSSPFGVRNPPPNALENIKLNIQLLKQRREDVKERDVSDTPPSPLCRRLQRDPHYSPLRAVTVTPNTLASLTTAIMMDHKNLEKPRRKVAEPVRAKGKENADVFA
ncbi:hypothetical protein R3P38DRAFT_3282904 [Favolaschia claudopus]|uniref:Uncharacterized protein n=1 Tax=Favolaschia claudopus TaxID=2862362 RepID=A0AAW0AA69_9AGAR